MIRIIFLFTILGAGLFVGTQFSGQQGYVLISIANTTIEMSVTTLVIMIVALLAVLFGLEYLIKKVLYMSSTTWNWFSVRKMRRARRYTNEGIIKLLEGDWPAAEKKVIRWANHHDMPLLCYLIASEAAQEMGDNDKRNQYLELAQQQDNSELVVQLTKARQQVRDQEFETALQTLSQIQNKYPNNQMLLNLLKTIYINLNKWQPLLDIMPGLVKAGLVEPQEQAQLAKQAQCGLIIDAAGSKGSKGALRYWNSLPRKIRQDGDIIACLAKQLMVRNADHEAYTLVTEFLKKHHDDTLVQLIPQMNLADIHPAVIMLQKWLEKNESDAVAHSAIAQLYIGQQKWADAQSHLEKALSIRKDVSDYAYLARVLEEQNMVTAASDVSKQALMLIK